MKDKAIKNVEQVMNLLGLSDNNIENWDDFACFIKKNLKPNLALLTDFYEFIMAQTYFDTNDKDTKAYFDVFYRSNVDNSGYSINGGLREIIEFVQNFHFTKSDIDYLRNVYPFSESFLEYLKNLKFNGDIWAIPDGTPIFPNEPVITVRANIIEAQLLETLMLAYFNHGNLVATKAKRITKAADSIKVADFGARRGHGESVIQGSEYATIGGCISTSNTLAAKVYNLTPTGTMAHALVEFYGNDYDAFMAFAKSNPTNCVFLVDTFNTLQKGIPAAIRVAKEFLIPNGYPFLGIRIDSGNLTVLSKEARRMLDEAGFTDTKIFLTNGLDEDSIISLKMQDTPMGALGVGDNIIAPKERSNGVYKLVSIEKNNEITSCIKLSEDEIKITNPGYKRVYRLYDKKEGYVLGDVVALADEIISEANYTLKEKIGSDYTLKELQVPIFKSGKLIYDVPSTMETAKYCENQFKTLPEEVTRRKKPHEYYVGLTEKLLNLKTELIKMYSERNGKKGDKICVKIK